MSKMSERQQAVARRTFKYMNRFMLLMWRLGLGGWLSFWPPLSGRILVITHTGRKTGLKRRTPVNYAIIDGDIYVTAGFGTKAHWYRNMMATPAVEVWLPDGWWQATAEDITTTTTNYTGIMRRVLKGSGFAAFLAGIDPYRMTDDELRAATETYRVLRLRRVAPCTGPGGPGTWAWVWPLATFIALPVAFMRRKR